MKISWFRKLHEHVKFYKRIDTFSDAENSRSACFDWHNFLRTGIKFEIWVHISLFGLASFVKFVILTCLFKKILAALYIVTVAQTIEHHGRHSWLPENQSWDQVPGGVGVSWPNTYVQNLTRKGPAKQISVKKFNRFLLSSWLNALVISYWK